MLKFRLLLAPLVVFSRTRAHIGPHKAHWDWGPWPLRPDAQQSDRNICVYHSSGCGTPSVGVPEWPSGLPRAPPSATSGSHRPSRPRIPGSSLLQFLRQLLVPASPRGRWTSKGISLIRRQMAKSIPLIRGLWLVAITILKVGTNWKYSP